MLQVTGAHVGVSEALVEEVYDQGKGENERGSARASRVRGCPLERSGGRCACERRQEEGEGGGQGCSVSQTSRRIVGGAGEAQGGLRRLEGGGYSAGVHCSALWSMPIACQGMPLACRARPLVSGLCREE